MASVDAPTASPPLPRLNVSDRLTSVARSMPASVAVACPRRSLFGRRTTQRHSGARYETITFEDLDNDATRIARGLLAWGVPPGTRLALLVRPGIEFVTLVFALLRAGMVIVLVDPGMGRRNLIRCLEDAQHEGFVAVGIAQFVRALLRHKFPKARWNVTVGRRWFWDGITLDQVRDRGGKLSSPQPPLPVTQADDPAAIIFTSGSTGLPKGVLYTHRMFDTQVAEIRSTYDVAPGNIDLACFPLFALFNSAMGVTTVLPDMDFSRPAAADPRRLLAAANDWQVTQAFASPAVWRVVGDYCEKTGERIPSLRHIFSCGAPVPADVLRRTLASAADEAKMHTPYGATECLPVATIESAEVLVETARRTGEGAGVCVGRKFDSVEWRIIRITDAPLTTIAAAATLPPGQIGELIVRGPQTSPRYVTRVESNADAKIPEHSLTLDVSPEVRDWHRMGDVGYLDEHDRFWYCGRKSQRVETADGPLYTECVEPIFNTHPHVQRSALVGVGDRGQQTPVLVVELTRGNTLANCQNQLRQLARVHAHTRSIRHFLAHPRLPVDVRHNAKINREQLAQWAARQIAHRFPGHLAFNR